MPLLLLLGGGRTVSVVLAVHQVPTGVGGERAMMSDGGEKTTNSSGGARSITSRG